jgi:integrase
MRLTQAQCERAMPTERVVPVSDAAAIEAETLRALRQGRRPDKRVRFRGIRKLGVMAAELENAKQPAIVKRTTKWLCDGLGLVLVVSPNLDDPDNPESVRRSWIFRWNAGRTVISKSGKARRLQKRIGLGSLSAVPLSRARELADICRRHLQEGRDPLLIKRGQAAQQKVQELQLKTLRAAVDEYLVRHSAGWSRKHAQGFKHSFDHLQPLLDLPCAQIDQAMIVRALTPLWQARPDSGRRLRGKLFQVLSAATSWGWRTGGNPADWELLKHSFVARSKLQPVKHFAALPYRDAPAYMKVLLGMDGVCARGLELLIRTGVRTGEICSAMGDQFDLDAATWTVPPEKTKTGKRTGKPHIVPLSDAAVACLRKVEVVPGRLVFPVHDRALYRLNKSINGGCVVHGWRKTLRTWAADMTEFAWEVAESILDHQVGNDVQRRYVLTTWQDKRRLLLQQWSDFISGKTSTADNVVPLRA